MSLVCFLTDRKDLFRSWRRLALLRFLLACFAALGLTSGAASADDYLLRPQDTLKIRVFEWRPSTGSSFEWVPLTGEFTVSAAGNLSLPIIGTVPVMGQTTEQVSEAIGKGLQSQVGLQKQPNVSVEISAYRPFFVTGLVAAPGKYTYMPGLTVVQAMSMAGGIGSHDNNLIGLQRDTLTSRGDIRALQAERLDLVARQARVDAILKNASTIEFPAELTSKQSDPAVARMIDQETALFEARKRSSAAEIDALNQAKILATSQIDSLKEKAVSLAKQIDLAHKELGSIDKLVNEGLTVTARRLGANQDVADLEGRNLDVSLAILKAQQDLAKVAQDVGDVQDKYRITALTEAAELRDRFAANAARMKTARDLIDNMERQAPAAVAGLGDDGDGYSFTTTIDRLVNGSNKSLIVSDNDPVEPGDVLRVARRSKDDKPGSAANGELN